jgi:hypothetical protein
MKKTASTKFRVHLTRVYSPMVILALGYILIALFLGVLLHFDFWNGDVISYWMSSVNWQVPFQQFHVPLFPLEIALFRGLTLDAFRPLFLLMGINFLSLMACTWLIYCIIQARSNNEFATLGALLFGFWPFVGLTYTVDPLADLPALFFVMLGLYLLLRSRPLLSAPAFGLAIITHKAMWPAVGLISLAFLFLDKEHSLLRKLSFAGIVLLPIVILWLGGALYHHSLTWIISSNLKVELTSQSNFIIADGLFGTILKGGIKGILKVIVLLAFMAGCVISVCMNKDLTSKYRIYGITISIAAIILFIVLNQHEIWSAARFSRVVAIPLTLEVYSRFKSRLSTWRYSPAIATVLIILLFLSQFAYATYINVYFG